ncbi:hypothetical protein [Paucibacter sp. M5-1]|uniref:hypothetical protein n=1 Tax=Paucibacter sp. M5-1 TaxID=3015998 RepID=UPI0022B91FF9|nr:hypothetical protein [Paucibacter sp. M5-1]MCZ7883045.1 hypothetical protein [Paucibacter sp. M5-1]
MSRNALFDLPSKFFIGVNYWASHAGTMMWSDWRAEQVDLDLQRLAAAGIDLIRVFPLWPDFQPIHSLYGGEGGHAGYRFGDQRLPDDEAGRAGMSMLMMARFAELCAIADKHGIKLVIGLITGWMSGRLFVPPALAGKGILTDPDSIRWQVRFVSYFVKTTKKQSAIIAWDLGNECNVMEKVQSPQQAYVWTAALANAIKAQDGSRPLLSGMHSLAPKGCWTMQDQGELTDILTTHPYPLWTPYLDYDPLTTMRPSLHATVESLFYSQLGGKPCFAEEMGTMGPMVCSETVAGAFARTSLWSQWAHGLPGMMWWCAYDQTRLQTAPYDWTACEGELGLLTEDGRVKPALQQMDRVKRQVAALPELPPRWVEAVCVLNSAQDHWAVALGAFMLAKQAGFDVDFRFEDQPLPDADFYLLPCVTGPAGVPKQRWEQLLAKVRTGATLYLSSNDGYMLNFAELTGLRVENRSRRAGAVAVRLKGEQGPVLLNLSAAFKLDFSVERAEVLASEPDGNAVLTRATYGEGQVYFCALPLELNVVQKEGVSHQPETFPLWRIYETISALARSARALQVQEPHLGLTEHVVDAQTRIAVLINYSEQDRVTTALLKPGWTVDEVLQGPSLLANLLRIQANDVLILRLVHQDT